YMIGVRNHADSSELEEYWLDNRASMRHHGQRAPFPDEDVELAVMTHFPEAYKSPETFSFEPLRLTFLDIGFKVDAALTARGPRGTAGAPRVRGLYNKERAEIIRRTRAVQAARALERGRLYPRGVEIEAWRKALRAEDLGPGEMTEVELDGTKILIANADGEYYALDAHCTHAGELGHIQGLVEGELDIEKMCITCPWHGSQFNLSSGRVIRQPYSPEFKRDHVVGGRLLSLVDVRRKAKDLRTYETKLEDEYVWV